MDFSKLNPQVQKLLNDIGESIDEEEDFLALSQVSVKDLAKLFEQFALETQSNKPRKKEEVFRNWKEKLVQTYLEKNGQKSNKKVVKESTQESPPKVENEDFPRVTGEIQHNIAKESSLSITNSTQQSARDARKSFEVLDNLFIEKKEKKSEDMDMHIADLDFDLDEDTDL